MNNRTVFVSSTLMMVLALSLSPAQSVEVPKTGVAPEVVACLSDDNSPFSSADASGSGVDVDVSRGLGEFLHRPVRLSWVTVPGRGGLGKAMRQSLKAGNCDLFFGIPVSGATNDDVLEQQLEISVPYATASYVLVAAKGSNVRTLDDAAKAPRVGVVTATPADMYLHKQRFNRIPFGNNRDLLTALSEGAVNAGVLWLPALANARRQGFELWPNAIRDEHLQSPGLETRFVIAIRKGEPQLKDGLNAALAHMQANGLLASILQRHGIGQALAQR